MIRKYFEHLLKPRDYALYLHCRKCNQRMDSHYLVGADAKEFLKLWNTYHNHQKEEN